MLIRVYTCQNATFFEIACHSSYVFLLKVCSGIVAHNAYPDEVIRVCTVCKCYYRTTLCLNVAGHHKRTEISLDISSV